MIGSLAVLVLAATLVPLPPPRPVPPGLAQDPARPKPEVDAHKELQAVASRTLTWLTGGSEQNDYVSVGRLAHYFGFIRFRVASGHTLDRSTAGQETYALLDPAQRARLQALLEEQREPHAAVVAARLRMNRALEGMLVGEAPAEQDFRDLGRAYGAAEAELGRVIAIGLGEVAVGLREDQRAALAAMRERYLSGGMGKFRLPRDLAAFSKGMPREDRQEFWALVCRLLTWVTGTPEDNDFETVGKPSQHFGFVSLRIESDHGVQRGGIAREVLDLLEADQRRTLEEVAEREVAWFRTYLARRSLLLRELERALAGERPDPRVVARHGAELGEIEARMTWGQAHGILAVRDAMSAEQAEALLELRARFTPVAAAPGGTEGAAATEGAPAAPSARSGRELFALCALCHVAPAGGRAAGPDLTGVLGRPIAGDPAYPFYTPAMRALAAERGRWNEALLDEYLAKPRALVPGTGMGFDGLASAAERRNLIAYLGGREEAPALPPPAAPSASGAGERPNIVLLLSDDQGWDGLSVEMLPGEPRSAHPLARTPRLAELAAQGMRFSQAYAPAPVCSPTRASLQTGKNPARLGWTKAAKSVDPGTSYRLVPPAGPRGLGEGEVTVAERLLARGYATAHFGKWHLSGGGPGAHGYEVHDGDTGNQDAIPFTDPNPVDIFGMVERATDFFRASAGAGRPFFAQLSFHALHHPENASPAAIAEVAARAERAPDDRRVQRAALAQDLDRGVGQLLDALDELGLAGNTYVLYLSDNGSGGAERGLLSAGKGSLGEGGIRVPMIVRGPAVPAGSVSHAPVVGWDLYPTFLDWAGDREPLPEGVEGVSLTGLFRGGSDPLARPTPGLLFHFPHYQGQGGPQSSLRVGDEKLVRSYEDGRDRLFDLASDPGETRDLAAERPERAAELGRMLGAELTRLGALLPTPNPAFDPATVPSGPQRKGGGQKQGGERKGGRRGG